ncbi:tripartite tricarboxylate transporter TctB family protein [Mailhella massiliensis]|uniref:tripartite tricarboxylate transporter TctB family protein n=1 Tax=Mailhella massiliensis TaxID=1903261 RepID=UPI00097D100D|nr:tripartite tricarboxylate transporter TctB family protein [Mailhella massiliensis]
MYRTHILSSLFSILFGIILLVWIIPTQTPEWPGYGMPASMLPNILAWIIIISASINLIKVFLTGYGKGQEAPLSPRMFAHLLGFVAILAAAMPLMSLCGYFIGGAIIMLTLCLLCGERNPIRLIIVAAATLLVIWAALWKGLSVLLPGM